MCSFTINVASHLACSTQSRSCANERLLLLPNTVYIRIIATSHDTHETTATLMLLTQFKQRIAF